MSRPDRQSRSPNGVSGFRLRQELIETLPPEARAATVSQAMERVTFTVHPELDLAELLSMLVDGGAQAVPVVDPSGELLGVVSKGDVLNELCGVPLDGEERLAANFGGVWEEAASRGLKARDVMTPRAVVVAEETSLAGGAALIARGIHPVPVVDDDGRVTGTLSSVDVLRWLARNHRNPEL